jgi:hypothetical protein
MSELDKLYIHEKRSSHDESMHVKMLTEDEGICIKRY